MKFVRLTKPCTTLYAKPMRTFFSKSKYVLLCSSLLGLLAQSYAFADVLTVDASLLSNHISRGVKLSNNGPLASSSLEWNADNGVFAGLNCFTAGEQNIESFERACFSFAGLFSPINNKQAWSIEARRYDYKSSGNADWDNNEVTISWHHRNGFLASLSVSDNWLARDTKALALDLSYRQSISERFSAVVEAAYIDPIESGRLEDLASASLGLEYQRGLWSSSIKVFAVEADIDGRLFSVQDQQNLLWTISYQIY